MNHRRELTFFNHHIIDFPDVIIGFENFWFPNQEYIFSNGSYWPHDSNSLV